ncbi:Succinate dehydrogenase [ubiquinone] iron-sulfur subunit, partial [Fusarium oxysporum f. sp. albedinis]
MICCCDDGFSARDSETPEDEGSELDDEPLDESDVVEDLDEGDEEDDGGDDAEEEVASVGDVFAGQECNTSLGEAQKISGAVGDEAEDVVSNGCSQDEETDDVLREHAANDSAPVDALAVLASSPEDEEKDSHSEKTNGAVLTGVVSDLLRNKSADENSSYSDGSASESAQVGGDEVVDPDGGVEPDLLDDVGDMAAGNVEEDQTENNGEPQEEGNNPVLVIAVQDERRNPPACEEAEDEEVDYRAAVAIYRAETSAPADDSGGVAVGEEYARQSFPSRGSGAEGGLHWA